MSAWTIVAGGMALLALGVFSGCESNQDRSARLEKEASTVLLGDEGLKVTKENPDVKVLSTAVLSEAEGSAVVVEVHNDSGQNLVDVPIALNVLDAKGKSVYRNDEPGLEPALVSIPYLAAGSDGVWVNDQILATGKPATAKVRVGVGGTPFSGEQPNIEVTPPHLESGMIASGEVINRTGEDQRRLLLYTVARKGGQIVAAGRGAFEHLKPETKPLHYHVYLIGKAAGAELTLSRFPTLAVPGEPGEPGA
jgi:hypothetical protein